MTTAWFLIVLAASYSTLNEYGADNGVSAMHKSFTSEKECLEEAKSNPKLAYTRGPNTTEIDHSIKVGIVCIKGILR